MIITSKKSGCIGVPGMGLPTPVNLVPGVQEVADELWVLARPAAKKLLADGVITEEWVLVDEAVGKDHIMKEVCTEKGKVSVPAKISMIERRGKRLDNLIKGVYHIPTIDAWLAQDSRADVRLELLTQKDNVQKGKIKG